MTVSVEDRISAFIAHVEKIADTKTRNLIAASTGRWDRYLRFLDVILARFEAVTTSYLALAKAFKDRAAETGTIGEGLRDLMLTMSSRGECLHLEIESFYMFAKILLDRVADTLLFYFREPPTEWGSSHSALAMDLPKICAKLGIEPAVAPLVQDMKRRVVDWRTKMIEHQSDPRRILSTTWGPAGPPNISMGGILYPESHEEAVALTGTSTEDPNVLRADLHAYIHAVVEFMQGNIEKSIAAGK